MAELFDGGLGVIISTCLSWRCVIREVCHDRSGAGQMWRAHHLPGPCSRSAHTQPPPVPLLDGLTGLRRLAHVRPPRLVP
jgi:hypothetical protein